MVIGAWSMESRSVTLVRTVATVAGYRTSAVTATLVSASPAATRSSMAPSVRTTRTVPAGRRGGRPGGTSCPGMTRTPASVETVYVTPRHGSATSQGTVTRWRSARASSAHALVGAWAGPHLDCSGDPGVCEWDCDTTEDCEDFHCNKEDGYECKCKSNRCAFVKKTKECSTTEDCEAKNLCMPFPASCFCSQGSCRTFILN